jgi:hypothetical protein
MLEGCGVLSYWVDRPGRLLTQRWLKADLIDGLRTVSGFDGGFICNDRDGWRFFGRYHKGQPRHTIVFEVYLDGQRVFRSGVVSNSVTPILVSVPLGKARALRLVTRDANDGIACDHANWAMARLVPYAPLVLQNPCCPGPGQFEFTLSGPAVSACIVEVSSDLLTWTPIATNAPFQGSLVFSPQPTAAPGDKCFYRAKLVP